MAKPKKEKKDSPPVVPAPVKGRAAAVVLLVLALVGVGLAMELTRIYVKVRIDPSFQTVCAVNQKVNCMTAAESKYAALFELPTSVIGLGGYLAMAAVALLALFTRDNKRKASALAALLITAASIVVGAYLFYVSEFVIKVLCPYCMATYGVNLVCFISAVLLLRAVGGKQAVLDLIALLEQPASFVKAVAPAGLAVVILAAAPAGGFKLAYGKVKAEIPKLGEFRVGMTPEGYPWIGAAHPLLTIHSFTDYQCPHCKKTDASVRQLLAKYKDKVRFIHRNLPLDEHCHPLVKRPFHPCSCLYASYAVCAGQQGGRTFWEVSDYLFASPEEGACVDPATVIRDNHLDADAMNQCLASDLPGKSVMKDINDSMRLGIMGTPTFVVDGNTLPGNELNEYTIDALLQVYDKKQ